MGHFSETACLIKPKIEISASPCLIIPHSKFKQNRKRWGFISSFFGWIDTEWPSYRLPVNHLTLITCQSTHIDYLSTIWHWLLVNQLILITCQSSDIDYLSIISHQLPVNHITSTTCQSSYIDYLSILLHQLPVNHITSITCQSSYINYLSIISHQLQSIILHQLPCQSSHITCQSMIWWCFSRLHPGEHQHTLVEIRWGIAGETHPETPVTNMTNNTCHKH